MITLSSWKHKGDGIWNKVAIHLSNLIKEKKVNKPLLPLRLNKHMVTELIQKNKQEGNSLKHKVIISILTKNKKRLDL